MPQKEEFEFLLDAIITPTRVIRTDRGGPQPKGIFWEKISQLRIDNMPILKELRDHTSKDSR